MFDLTGTVKISAVRIAEFSYNTTNSAVVKFKDGALKYVTKSQGGAGQRAAISFSNLLGSYMKVLPMRPVQSVTYLPVGSYGIPQSFRSISNLATSIPSLPEYK